MLYFIYYNSIQHSLNYLDNKDSLLDPKKRIQYETNDHLQFFTLSMQT